MNTTSSIHSTTLVFQIYSPEKKSLIITIALTALAGGLTLACCLGTGCLATFIPGIMVASIIPLSLLTHSLRKSSLEAHFFATLMSQEPSDTTTYEILNYLKVNGNQKMILYLNSFLFGKDGFRQLNSRELKYFQSLIKTSSYDTIPFPCSLRMQGTILKLNFKSKDDLIEYFTTDLHALCQLLAANEIENALPFMILKLLPKERIKELKTYATTLANPHVNARLQEFSQSNEVRA